NGFNVPSGFLAALGRTSGAMLIQSPTSACLTWSTFMRAPFSGGVEIEVQAMSAVASSRTGVSRRIRIVEVLSCHQIGASKASVKEVPVQRVVSAGVDQSRGTGRAELLAL